MTEFKIQPVMRGSGKPSGFRRLKKTIMYGGKKRRLYSHPQHGMGFFDFLKNAGSWVYNKVLKPVGNFVKDNKLVSKVLPMLGSYGKAAAPLASAVGLGRRRRRRQGGKGRGVIIT